MKKLWSIILLIGLVNAQMPEPTMVGQEKLQVPTLSINNFVNQAEIEGLEDTRVFLGITNILTENVMDSRYDLVEQDSDFELTARVIYLGRPRTATTFLGLFRRETTTTEVRVIVELKKKAQSLLARVPRKYLHVLSLKEKETVFIQINNLTACIKR